MKGASRSILGNAAVVGAMTFVSRLGGLVREVLMAHFFGTGLLKSAFDVAFKIPNLFRRLFGEGALSTAFIPVFTEISETRGRDEANRYAARCAGLLFAALAPVALAGILLTYPAGRLAGAGGKWAAILPLLRIMLPYAPLICIAALAMGVLNARRSFTVSALAPAFLNLVWILALAVVCPLFTAAGDQAARIRIVAWAVVAAGVVQVLVQLPALRACGVPVRMDFGRRVTPEIRRTLSLMVPMVVSGGVTQINVIMDGVIALYASARGPAALQYAERLVYLPLGLIGNAYGTVLLPVLSSFAAKRDYRSMEEAVGSSLRDISLVMLPAAAGLVALAGPVVSLIYRTGRFDDESVRFTARALAGYGPGLLFFALYKAIVPAFYALQDTGTPMRVGLRCVGLNFVLNVVFVCVLPRDWKHVGIAFATVICSFLNCAALLSILRRRLPASGRRGLLRQASRDITPAVVSAVLMAFAGRLAWSRVFTCLGARLPGRLAMAAAVAAAMLLSAAVYFGCLGVARPAALRGLAAGLRGRAANRRRRA